MTILVDLDNVMVDLNTIWVKYLNEMYGTDVKPDDITAWDMQKFFPTLTRSQIFKPFKNVKMWEEIEPIEGAQYYMQKLIDEGHQVYVCTSTFYPYIDMKYRKVIRRLFPFIDWKNVIVTSNKSLINADVLIDDAPQNFGNWYEVSILFTAPHNKNIDNDVLDLSRADNWKDVYEIIQDVAIIFGER